MKNIAAKILSISLVTLIVLSILVGAPTFSGFPPRSYTGPGTGKATFYVTPQDSLFTSPANGTWFHIQIRMSSFVDVYSWQYQLIFKTALLYTTFMNITEVAGTDYVFYGKSRTALSISIDPYNATYTRILASVSLQGSTLAISGTDKGLTDVWFQIIKDAGVGQTLSTMLYFQTSGDGVSDDTWTIDNSGFNENDCTMLDGYYEIAGAPVTRYDLTVHVKDAVTKSPIVGAEVDVTGPESRSASTNSTGYVVFLDLLPGDYTVTTSATGYQSNSTTITLDQDKQIQIELNPIPPPPTTGTLNGTVTDSSTTLPVEGATVTANGMSTTTDSSGNYQITLDAGTYSVTAEKTGYVANTVTGVIIIAEETTTVDIALTPIPPPPTTGTLNGTVTDASTTLPVQGATVTANGGSTTTDSSGHYQITLDAGTYTVMAEKTGYVAKTVTNVVIIAEQTTTVDFALTPIPPPPTAGTLNGTVTDASTTLPLEGATVTANGQSATTDSSGHYEITLEAGTYSVTAEKTGYVAKTVTGVVIIAEQTATVDFALAPIPPPPTTGIINGTVTDASTTLPIQGVTVTANGVSDTTDAEGHYEIEIAPGTYTVTAGKTGYVSASKSATVTAGMTTTVDFSLEPIVPDFSISASPDSLTIVQGNSGISTITVTSLNGLNSAVSLSVSGTPAGVTASFSVNPITPPSDGSISSTLTVIVEASAIPGTYTLTITGTSGVLSHTVDVSLAVIAAVIPDFSISVSPSSLTITQGSSDSSTITVTSLDGFNSVVDLTFSGNPTGVTATLSPTSVTPPPDGSVTSTLTVLVDATAAPGNYMLAVTGTSGSLTHSTTISLVVKAVQAIRACVEIKPETLNLRSKGRWVVCFIRLPQGYDVSDIDVSTIMLNGTIPAEKAEFIRDCSGRIVGLMVKFDRARVMQLILNSIHPGWKKMTVELTVTGSLKDGTQFQGSDKIGIIDPPCHRHHHHQVKSRKP